MENLNIPEGELTQRQIPKDVFDASVISQRGDLVDVTSLTPAREGEGRHSFQSRVQRAFDSVANTVNSPEYAQFNDKIGELLNDVRGHQFIFDIEGVIMNSVQNLKDLSERVYYILPWMLPVIKKLIENGNSVGFYTSAPKDSLEEMKKAMDPELAQLPAISIDVWEQVASAYKARKLGQMTDNQVLEVMQSVYPTASEDCFKTGVSIFDDDETLEYFEEDPTSFLTKNKLPQLFIPSENGFFIDDDETFIESAIYYGWPDNRAIKCEYNPQKNQVLEVAQAIKDGMKQQ